KKYNAIRTEILGEDTIEELEGRGKDDEELAESEDEEEAEEVPSSSTGTNNGTIIKDATETDLINLRRTIYLTIMSSVDFNECAHKMLKIKLNPGQEIELANMIIECCSQERTYMR